MSRDNAIQTTHDLDFEQAEWQSAFAVFLSEEVCKELGIQNDDKFPQIKWKLFRVGTCTGQWRLTPEACEILSVINDKPNNGHFNDVLEWLEWSCREMKKPLRILAFTNEKFKQHLLTKRGFHEFGNDVEKTF